MKRMLTSFAAAVCLAVASSAVAQPAATTTKPTPRSVRITMDTLHMLGGVPPGWMLTPPSGDAVRGRALFAQLGCPACHAVQGEGFPPPSGPGPELSGMGSHHPPGYFVESILNPEAVLVDGPGFIGTDGRSTMPRYPDMTLAQLGDVVAYLESLTMGGMAHPMPLVVQTMVNEADLPPPPSSPAKKQLVQVYQVKADGLAAFEDWFRREGAARFLAQPGLLSVDTWVDRSRSTPNLVTVIGFKDEASFLTFSTGPDGQKLGERFDEFIGPHGHDVLSVPPLYRVEALSAPSGGKTSALP